MDNYLAKLRWQKSGKAISEKKDSSVRRIKQGRIPPPS